MVDDSASGEAPELQVEPAAVGAPPPRRALWAVLAVVAVIGGALAVNARTDGPSPRLPVALGSTGGREAAAGSMSSDMAIAWMHYVAGDGLPSLGGEAPAYRVVGRADAAQVRTVARALGLTDDPVHEGDLWHVRSGEALLEVYEGVGTWWYSPTAGAATGDVSSSGGSASGGGSTGTGTETTTVEPDTSDCPPNAECIKPVMPAEPCPANASCAVAVACPADVPCAEPPAPTPPADLPTKAEARQIALDLLAATGMDLTDAQVTVELPFDGWSVLVEPRLDGVPVSGWQASVIVGSKGAIVNATGSIATAERVGTYPLIDARAAVERLNAMQGDVGGGPVPMGAPDGVTSDSIATDYGQAEPPVATQAGECKVQPDGTEICESTGVPVAPPDTGVAGCPVPAPQVAGEAPQPVEPPIGVCPDPIPYEEPKPVDVVLTDAERVLTMLPSFDGSNDVYVVPGYRFSNADGVIVEVVAVADNALAPTTTGPATPDTSAVTSATEPRRLEPGRALVRQQTLVREGVLNAR